VISINELENKVTEIYSILKAGYGAAGRFSDEKQKGELIRSHRLKAEDQDIPDFYFVLTLSWGPWREGRQLKVWLKVYVIFKEKYHGDLRLVGEDLGFPFAWQNQKVCLMGKFLRDKGMSFTDFLNSLQGKNGLEIKGEFERILGAGNNKTLSCFIRDYLQLNVFPIDRRIARMLGYLGLPKDEHKVVELCESTGVNPKELDRMLFTYYGEKCSRSQCLQCELVKLCNKGGESKQNQK